MPKDFEKVYQQWRERGCNLKEAAKRLNASVSTFSRWVKEWEIQDAARMRDEVTNKVEVSCQMCDSQKQ